MTVELKPPPISAAQWRARLQAELERFVAVLTADDPPERIILFGSMAGEREGLWSDIDLVIVRDTDRPFLDRTREVLAALRPRVGLDVLVYTPSELEDLCRRRPFFRDEILGRGKVLFERGG
jgi:predicted nucleotidyltransferase